MPGVSNITVTNLAVQGGIAGALVLGWKWLSPAGQGGLSYLQPKEFKIYSGTTNVFANATLLATVVAPPYTHGNLPASTTRYYWVVAVDKSGNESVIAGPANGTTAASQAGRDFSTNPIQNGEIADNAVTAAKMNVGSLSAISASLGSVTSGSITSATITGSLIRTAASGSRLQIDQASGNAAYLRVFNGSTTVVTLGTASITPSLVINAHSSLGIWSTGANSSDGHGVRAYGGGSSSTRGEIVIGVAAASGGHAAKAEQGGYASFTGVHDTAIRKTDPCTIGDIMVSTGQILGRGKGIDDVIPVVARSISAKQKGAYGVYSKRMYFDPLMSIAAIPMVKDDLGNPIETPVRKYIAETFDYLAVNAIGEGLMNVCGQSGNIEIGDYICPSDMAGKGMRQTVLNGVLPVPDDIQRSFTVAKSLEAVTFASATEVKLIAVTYHCG